MVMIPNYEFKMKLPVYDVNLLSTKKLDQKTHDTLIQKILAYPDVMKHNTNVKANMTDWRMHMKDDDFNKVAKVGDLVVFSGQAQHSVPPCECEDKRVMMAGNISVVASTLFLNLASNPNF